VRLVEAVERAGARAEVRAAALITQVHAHDLACAALPRSSVIIDVAT
jgi:hypothetical protein